MTSDSQSTFPTNPFPTFEPQNPSHDVLKLHKIRRSTDFAALKLWKGPSGLSATNIHLMRFFTSSSWPGKCSEAHICHCVSLLRELLIACMKPNSGRHAPINHWKDILVNCSPFRFVLFITRQDIFQVYGLNICWSSFLSYIFTNFGALKVWKGFVGKLVGYFLCLHAQNGAGTKILLAFSFRYVHREKEDFLGLLDSRTLLYLLWELCIEVSLIPFFFKKERHAIFE